jgi:nucleoside-diphosphate-sugar epimerase
MEELLRMYIRIGLIDKRKYTIIRPFTVYGPRQREELAIQKFIKQTLTGKPITVFGDGLQSRDFTYIDDICMAIKLLIETDKDYFDSYDIGSGDEYSLLEIIGLLAKITGKRLQIDFYPTNIYDVKNTEAHPSNLYETTGYIPDTRMEDGLRKQLEWVKRGLKE